MPKDDLLSGTVSGEPAWLVLILKLIIFLVGLGLFIFEAISSEPQLDLMFLYGWIMGIPGILSIRPR